MSDSVGFCVERFMVIDWRHHVQHGDEPWCCQVCQVNQGYTHQHPEGVDGDFAPGNHHGLLDVFYRLTTCGIDLFFHLCDGFQAKLIRHDCLLLFQLLLCVCAFRYILAYFNIFVNPLDFLRFFVRK